MTKQMYQIIKQHVVFKQTFKKTPPSVTRSQFHGLFVLVSLMFLLPECVCVCRSSPCKIYKWLSHANLWQCYLTTLHSFIPDIPIQSNNKNFAVIQQTRYWQVCICLVITGHKKIKDSHKNIEVATYYHVFFFLFRDFFFCFIAGLFILVNSEEPY